MFKRFFWLLVVDVLILGYIGGAEINPFNVALGQIAAAYYFLHFLVILPLLSKYEKPLPLPASITASVLHGEDQESSPAGVKTGSKTTTVAR
jgi:ubiquinol-cytochrome c reductase cytochrome b subunit